MYKPKASEAKQRELESLMKQIEQRNKRTLSPPKQAHDYLAERSWRKEIPTKVMKVINQEQQKEEAMIPESKVELSEAVQAEEVV